MSIFKKALKAVTSGTVGPLMPLKLAGNALGIKSISKIASVGNQISSVALGATLAAVGGAAAYTAIGGGAAARSVAALPSNVASTSNTDTLNKLAYGLGDVKNVVQTVAQGAQTVSNVAQGITDGLNGQTTQNGMYVQTSWLEQNMTLVIGGGAALLIALALIFTRKK